jgi:nucleotide-binding universal stress UspA family protein
MKNLKLLFTTHFSDSCFRAIPAVAQLADIFRIDITIAHVCPEGGSKSSLELHSFFAEAENYHSCRRIALEGAPVETIAELTRQQHFDLVVSPGSDRLGIPRPFHRSLRAELLKQGGAPLWTMSRGIEKADFRKPIRTIAAAVDGWDRDMTHVELAASFAERTGARLQLLTVVPPISDSTISGQAVRPQPLHPDRAVARIERLLCHWHLAPEVSFATGSVGREVPRMAAQCNADLLFLSEAQSTGGWFLPGLGRAIKHSPCPVIAIPSSLSPQFRWSFLDTTTSGAHLVLAR